MKADRLVAILLMLQSRGQVTAAEVALELEVSERTARRDLDALGMAGLPIYSRQGRNGGWQLIGGARTDLSGLTGPEARALFLVAGPSSTATPDVKAALRKLVSALPEPFRREAEAASKAVVTDPVGWGNSTPSRPPPIHLDDLQSAVIEAAQVRLNYVDRVRHATERVVHPLGLATKGLTWYLVADTVSGLRTFRVDRIAGVERTGEAVVRPEGFVLADAWKMISDAVNERRTGTWSTGSARADVVPLLRMLMGARLRIGPSTADGRVAVEVGSFDARALAGEVAGFGAGLRIDGPAEVVGALSRIARELSGMYPPSGGGIATASPEVANPTGAMGVVEISAADTHELRRAVLRDGDPKQIVNFAEDDIDGTIHLGVRDTDGELVAISTWIPRALDGVPARAPVQLRGMATAPALQGTGVGGLLLQASIRRFTDSGVDLLWARARDTALGFYVRHGFSPIGDGFVDEQTRLPHHVVICTLANTVGTTS